MERGGGFLLSKTQPHPNPHLCRSGILDLDIDLDLYKFLVEDQDRH